MRIKVEPIDQQTLMQLQDTAPKGVAVKLGGNLMRSDQLVAAIITFAAGPASSEVGTWLYDKIKDKPARVSVNRINVPLKLDAITGLIQQESAKE